VVPGVLSQAEVQTCLDLTWDWLESLGSGIERSDPASWTDNNWPGEFKSGITVQCGSSQQPSLWYLRGHPGVQEVFSSIWSVKPSELITSMDGMLIWRHKTSYSASPASGLNLHVDQDPFTKTGLHCVQGMIPLLDVTKDIGGLKLLPKSHSDEMQEQIRNEHLARKKTLPGKDFVKVEDAKYDPEAFVVEAKAGDLILWDSRVIHGSRVGPATLQPGAGLARCTGLVSMTPRAWASQEVLLQREAGFQSGVGFTHWAHEAVLCGTGVENTDGRNITWTEGQYKPLNLDTQQRSVL